jgi:hypothetical protein
MLDYLEILNGALATDIIVILLFLFGAFKSNALKKWYETFNLSAVIADVLILMLGTIFALLTYPYIFKKYSLIKLIGLAVAIQLFHDSLFALSFYFTKEGSSKIMDVFRQYKTEHNYWILLVDALMMISTILIMHLMKLFSADINIIVLISLVYSLIYLLNSV